MFHHCTFTIATFLMDPTFSSVNPLVGGGGMTHIWETESIGVFFETHWGVHLCIILLVTLKTECTLDHFGWSSNLAIEEHFPFPETSKPHHTPKSHGQYLEIVGKGRVKPGWHRARLQRWGFCFPRDLRGFPEGILTITKFCIANWLQN